MVSNTENNKTDRTKGLSSLYRALRSPLFMASIFAFTCVRICKYCLSRILIWKNGFLVENEFNLVCVCVSVSLRACMCVMCVAVENLLKPEHLFGRRIEMRVSGWATSIGRRGERERGGEGEKSCRRIHKKCEESFDSCSYIYVYFESCVWHRMSEWINYSSILTWCVSISVRVVFLLFIFRSTNNLSKWNRFV